MAWGTSSLVQPAVNPLDAQQQANLRKISGVMQQTGTQVNAAGGLTYNPTTQPAGTMLSQTTTPIPDATTSPVVADPHVDPAAPVVPATPAVGAPQPAPSPLNPPSFIGQQPGPIGVTPSGPGTGGQAPGPVTGGAYQGPSQATVQAWNTAPIDQKNGRNSPWAAMYGGFDPYWNTRDGPTMQQIQAVYGPGWTGNLSGGAGGPPPGTNPVVSRDQVYPNGDPRNAAPGTTSVRTTKPATTGPGQAQLDHAYMISHPGATKYPDGRPIVQESTVATTKPAEQTVTLPGGTVVPLSSLLPNRPAWQPGSAAGQRRATTFSR